MKLEAAFHLLPHRQCAHEAEKCFRDARNKDSLTKRSAPSVHSLNLMKPHCAWEKMGDRFFAVQRACAKVARGSSRCSPIWWFIGSIVLPIVAHCTITLIISQAPWLRNSAACYFVFVSPNAVLTTWSLCVNEFRLYWISSIRSETVTHFEDEISGGGFAEVNQKFVKGAKK